LSVVGSQTGGFALFVTVGPHLPIADEPQERQWMWVSGSNGDYRRAAHGYQPTREAAMAAFAKSWRRS
jgi:hypothetical protein